MAKYKRTVRGGRLVASVLYTRPEPGDCERVRAAKTHATTKARHALNLKQSRQKLEFTIAANFTRYDWHLVLTFDNAHLPKDRAGAIACFRRFIRLLRRHRRARGQDVKYIYAVEGKHGDKRLHIHVIINAVSADDIEIFRSLWEYGSQVNAERLEDREPSMMAIYLTKECEDGKPVGAKSWVGSKNLKQPTIEHDYVGDDDTLAAPPGCYVLERREETNEFGSFAYIKYILPEPRKRRSRSHCNSRSQQKRGRKKE